MGMRKVRLYYRKHRSIPRSLIVSLPKSIYIHAPFPSFPVLRERFHSLGLLPKAWLDIDDDISNTINFRKLFNAERNIFISLTIYNGGTWKLTLHNTPIKCSLLNHIPAQIKSLSEVLAVIDAVDTSHFCFGNSEVTFCDVQTLSDAYVLDSTTLEISTVRHKNCELLIDRSVNRCNYCTKYRDVLRKTIYRHSNPISNHVTSPRSHANYRYLLPNQLKQRLHNMHNTVRTIKAKLTRLLMIKQSLVYNGVELDVVNHNDLVNVMSSYSKQIQDTHAKDSFQRIFWEQQQKAASYSDPKSMRWHPLIIKWCLYLHHMSSGAYETFRTSGILRLPSQRTLRDYTHYIKASCRFSNEVDNDLLRAADYYNLEEWEKCVGILIDEMHIKEDLVYDKHTGALIGFISLGDVNDQLLKFERSLDESNVSQSPPLANSMYVFMVRGLFTSLQYPYVQLACKDLTGELLFQPFWEAVFRLERCDFKVLSATFDGASINRKLIKLHGLGSKDLLHKVQNPYSADNRYLYFISDPPHLVKTTRNCLFNSSSNLWCKGKSILWRHVESLYLQNSGAQHDLPGLSLVPKLKYEHIYLNNFSKMRVDLAAQVLSESVSKAIYLTGGPQATETALFCDMFDKFFDCLNVRNYDSGKFQRKCFRDPYRSATDFRLEWLEEVFIKYLEEWEKSVKERSGFTNEEKKRMLLSSETRTGLMITVKSFVDLTRYMFTIPGVKTFLSENLSQDPIEKFFGCQRQRCRTSENPNVQEFCNGTQALRVINTFCRDPIKGNCRGNSSKRSLDFEKESLPLPKRRRKQQFGIVP